MHAPETDSLVRLLYLYNDHLPCIYRYRYVVRPTNQRPDISNASGITASRHLRQPRQNQPMQREMDDTARLPLVPLPTASPQFPPQPPPNPYTMAPSSLFRVASRAVRPASFFRAPQLPRSRILVPTAPAFAFSSSALRPSGHEDETFESFSARYVHGLANWWIGMHCSIRGC